MIKNKIFLIPKPSVSAKVRLFCFPYAGGSAATYVSWAKHFGDQVELVLIQPPGRASRIKEPAHDRMESLILELMAHVAFITSIPYIFFGHSLGSRVAYELVHEIRSNGLSQPKYFIASGSRAPHIPNSHESIYDLPQDKFVQKLESLNGTPKEVLANNKLLALVTPSLRADFKIADTHVSQARPIQCPVLVLGGEYDDIVSSGQLATWEEVAENGFSLEYIAGDHFFIDQNKEIVINKIKSAISAIPQA